MFQNFFPENRAGYEVMWKKFCTAGESTDNITRPKRFAFWITKATNTRSEYVTILAFFTATVFT
jgi:hypothetical protein